ncbi:MAG: T9SS type A sorting domain-containing protein, partial [Bacteroidales bacterium]
QVSSKQTAGGTEPGPRDFKLQYRLGTGGTWTDISGGTIVTGNDWATGVLDKLVLPEECSSQNSIFLRWLMTSNLDINGAVIVASGKAKIDDILVTGETASGIEELTISSMRIRVYPNPCAGKLRIETENELKKVEVYSMSGSKVFDQASQGNLSIIDMTGFDTGRYTLVIHVVNEAHPFVRPVVKN